MNFFASMETLFRRPLRASTSCTRKRRAGSVRGGRLDSVVGAKGLQLAVASREQRPQEQRPQKQRSQGARSEAYGYSYALSFCKSWSHLSTRDGA